MAAITLNSVGHFFATFFAKVEKIVPEILKAESAVETATAAVPVYGPLALPAEKLAAAALGEFAAVLTAGGAAAAAKLIDAGLDTKVVQAVEEFLASVPNITALAKKL